MSTKYLGGIKESFVNSIGTELDWGWSPALDFLAMLQLRGLSSSSSSSTPKAAATTDATGAKHKPIVVAFDEDGFPVIDEGKRAMKADAPAAAAAAAPTTTTDPINILLLGAADIRHIMLTLSRTQRTELGRSGRPVHFYIFEPSLRVHCRHLLFLQMLLVDLVTLSELEDRVSTVLEIYGNSMIRDVTAASLKSSALAAAAALELENEEEEADVQKNNGDDDAEEDADKKKSKSQQQKQPRKLNKKLASWLDWTHTKSKEKDFIATQLLLWTRDRTSVDIITQWDNRVRTELAERYDNRVNIFDWEFNFSLLDYSQIVRFPEYREFRKMGMAFDYCRINPRRGFRYDYTVANKSLALFNARSGQGAYLGDIKNGPFFALGHDTENSNLKKREMDGTTVYGAGIIAMHNVRAWLYELVTGGKKPFPIDIEHKIAWDNDKNYNFLPSDAPEPHVEFTPQVPPCNFSFVGLDIERFYERVARDHKDGFFDAVFVGATSTQWMTSALFKLVNSQTGFVSAETLKFVVDAKDDAKLLFEQKIEDMAAAAGWAKDTKLTDLLHAHQMPPRQRPEGVAMEPSMKKAIERQKRPHQVILVAGKKN